jgi:hypothetical protein
VSHATLSAASPKVLPVTRINVSQQRHIPDGRKMYWNPEFIEAAVGGFAPLQGLLAERRFRKSSCPPERVLRYDFSRRSELSILAAKAVSFSPFQESSDLVVFSMNSGATGAIR